MIKRKVEISNCYLFSVCLFFFSRCQGTATQEIREGATYQSGIGLSIDQTCGTEDIQIQDLIPPPNFKPQLKTVPIYDHTLVFFDLETTGLGKFNNIRIS